MGKRFFKLLVSFKDELLDILYPPKEECLVCGSDGFIGLCHICRKRIKRDKENNLVLSYGQYGGIIKQLILNFKYKGSFTSGRLLVQFLNDRLNELQYYPDIILYVPVDRKTKNKRGFNQCEFLATELAKIKNCDCRHYIKKIAKTKEQKTLSFEQRQINIKNAFILKKSYKLLDKKVLIIDDVVTTGATLGECYKLLENIKVKDIKLLTVARSRL